MQIFEGDENGIDKKYLTDDSGHPLYPLFIISGYKEGLPEPNIVAFICTGNQLYYYANSVWSLTGGPSWPYYLRCDYNSGFYYFYSMSDWSGSTVFRVTQIWGV